MSIDALVEALRAVADPDRAAQMAAYMRDQFEFLGVQSVLRRKIAKPFFPRAKAVDWDFVDRCWSRAEREFQYVAADYLRAVCRRLSVEDLPRIKRMIVVKSWWDTVDGLTRTVGDVVARCPAGRDAIVEWARDENMWVRRVAIDHQLLRKAETDVELLTEIVEANLGSGEFFIDKAIGWALRDYSKTDPQWVRSFVERHRDRMSVLSVREASKYL